MPVRCPVGALVEAHRVMCLRTVKAMARGHVVEYGFASRGSKKCAYCIAQKGACTPIPVYVSEEFGILLDVLEAYQALPNDDDSQAAGLAAVQRAARSLSLCVQVTRAQEKDLGVSELLTASHHLLGQVLEQVSALNNRVASLETQVERGGLGGGRDRGGGSGEGQKKGKGKGKMVAVEEDSELSESEEDGEKGGGRGGDRMWVARGGGWLLSYCNNFSPAN
ncbi:hypothetical protein BDW02DRAFT_292709 [Decorospora gaudefroyi]|uniref:Uncharacterized protein n=1 Tax=Decorospora gaudefroyi TaxID=184978 RepID=A0A6A5K0K8_9PLEO|nr:hypothetical protein BDW02DRAFT_292709 [Decorospora gaudefroyi]